MRRSKLNRDINFNETKIELKCLTQQKDYKTTRAKEIWMQFVKNAKQSIPIE